MEFINSIEFDTVFLGTVGSVIAVIFLSTYRISVNYCKGMFYKIFNDPYSGYYGTFFTYKYVFSGSRTDPDIYSKELKVTRATLRIKPKLYYDASDYKFKGSMEIFGGNIYFNFEGVNHKELLYEVYKLPLLPQQFDKKVGIICGISEKSQPASSLRVISKEPLSDKDVKKLLGPSKLLIVK